MIQRTIYVAAEEVCTGSRQYLSLAMASPDGEWFYAEVTDIDAGRCSRHARENTFAQMRKVTETVFVKSANLRSAVASWLTRVAPAQGSSIEIRCAPGESVNGAALRELLAGHDELAARLVDAACEVDQAALEQGISRCGGAAKVGASSIVRAVLAAVCDRARQEPLGALHTRRFELLMGTRNATSLRAWIRRYERDRASPVAAAKSAGARRLHSRRTQQTAAVGAV